MPVKSPNTLNAAGFWKFLKNYAEKLHFIALFFNKTMLCAHKSMIFGNFFPTEVKCARIAKV